MKTARLAVFAFVISAITCSELYYGGYYSHQTTKSRLTGPNVCGSIGAQHCCPGWKLSPTSGRCNKPICKSGCGSGGICVRPNLCLCRGNKDLGLATRFATICEEVKEKALLQRDGVRRCQCVNGGVCSSDGSCKCAAGYGGSNCGRPLCADGCQNGGRCLSPNHCACQFGFAGDRCEKDVLRVGPCFTKIEGYQCLGALTGIKCTHSLCCATLGVGWGIPCERCPKDPHPCRRGYIYVAKEDNCQDIDECSAIAGLCVGGACVNTLGSFKCQCEAGQVENPDTRACEEIKRTSVCTSQPNACENGECVDSADSYYCRCYKGYQRTPDGKSCFAVEINYCFSAVLSGQCTRPMREMHSFIDCCCYNQGAGWGTGIGAPCQACPHEHTAVYQVLCTPHHISTTQGPLSQCQRFGVVCPNGQCIDISSTEYRCQCDDGYVLNSNKQCVDDDECMQMDVCKHGTCTNTLGSFVCKCDDGYALTPDNRSCTDMNECMENGMCPNGRCQNMAGAYKCLCNSGYRQSPNQQICYDINECVESSQKICSNGRCENSAGSYSCVCDDGYELSPDGAFCLDYNECDRTGMCHHGHCMNMDGTYRCLCNPGYRQSQDRRACIDIDECEAMELCTLGQCINTIGSFRCVCGDGLILNSDGRSCREVRKELCYKQVLSDGRCADPSSEAVLKSACCCTTMADSFNQMCWGLTPTLCPALGTVEYGSLCRNSSGMTSTGEDVNECTMFPNLCKNGICQNLLKTGYRCLCDNGFQHAPNSETLCVDVDECSLGSRCGVGGFCRNRVGSYYCQCHAGYQLNPTTHVCGDINECADNTCVNGICSNFPGGFNCSCPSYFTQHKNSTHTLCIDDRKYSCWSHYSSGGCEGSLAPSGLTVEECCNTFGQAWGSPCKPCLPQTPLCPRGYKPATGSGCVDVDECQLYSGLCENGRCVNTIGSFACRCADGLTLEGRRCIDVRTRNCYLRAQAGVCSLPMNEVAKRNECCCSIGQAWGDDCQVCPSASSSEYEALCGVVPSAKDFNECSAWPALCGVGRCVNTFGSFRCECPAGYISDNSGVNCTDINECQLNPLTCGAGTCYNLPGSFECDCQVGYMAHDVMKVCMDIDECSEDAFLCRGGSCINTDGSFSCSCPEGHELMPGGKACKDIDECSVGNSECSNGWCENFMGGYQCTCDKGYKSNDLRTACIDVNECEDGAGKRCEGKCENTDGSYHCLCQNGYKLSPNGFNCVDVNECIDKPDICGGGECENELGGYRCMCMDGLQLSVDQSSCTDVNECTRNASICGDGTCENTVGSYICYCARGYSKKPTDVGCTDDNECLAVNQCHEDSVCTNLAGSYECACKTGYAGDGLDCRDINECVTNNGGCDPDASCINTPGSFLCICDDGYYGNGEECFDIDECEKDLDLCENGQCLNDPGSFHCDCDMGFEPTFQQQQCSDIDECTKFDNLCMNGICENILGMFQCICNQGFELDESGSNCTDIDECLSSDVCASGECVNRDGSFECKCPPGFDLLASGNGCIDRRQGSCYMNVGYGACSDNYPERITRSKCCCSIGAGWGQDPGTCTECPANGTVEHQLLCPGGGGLVPTDKSGRITFIDLDECDLLPALCKGGTCQNTYGSFKCTCPPGYTINSLHVCVDINECEVYQGICGVGSCVNTDGGYTCVCPPGHLLMPDKNCMDMRKSACFTAFNESADLCENALSMQLTRKLCCCSVGKGWSDPSDLSCGACPSSGTDEFKALCGLRPGYIFDKEINECELIPDLCLNGECIDTDGGYTCSCYHGYSYDSRLLYCVDVDECLSAPCHQTAICRNEPGTYSCACAEGFAMSGGDGSCSDVNECEDASLCANGRCTNTVGGFVCVCNDGFTQSVSRRKCLDMNECDLQRDMCGNGTCTNMMGSYKCSCHSGFELGLNGRCQDVDECRRMRGVVCTSGRCRNLYGGFTCECQNGYRLSQDGQHCEDINECVEITNLCDGGTCTNYDGYYKCSCPTGYKLGSGGTICVDVDECRDLTDACLHGQCVNERGSYYCRCPPGFTQTSAAGLIRCMDTRYGQCYDGLHNGRCVGLMPVNGSRSSCCCAAAAAAAWSYSGVCEVCPTEGSNDYKSLCNMGPGYIEQPDGSVIDIDECLMHNNVCGNGECINTDGGYRCQCHVGYQLHTNGRFCVDVDECSDVRACGEGICSNTVGGFICSCNDGFEVGMDGTCTDTNECKNFNIHQCAFRCHNMYGSYVCTCPAGYQLSQDGKHCSDVDECLTSHNNCKYACKNLVGTFLCICPTGYEKVPGFQDECRDVDECQADPNICENGRCVNIDSGYRCECYSGYTPSPTGLSCVDSRRGTCHFSLDSRGRCPTSSSGPQSTYSFCCCSRGTAWGDSCIRCPEESSREFKDLCLFGPGFNSSGEDINECTLMPDACPNGRCLNTMGSYRCACNDGFKVANSGKQCIDINECEVDRSLCDYKCVNTLGSFECVCASGYSLSYDGRCTDINECSQGSHDCHVNATCVNNNGGYTCRCLPGFQAQRSFCLDINECNYKGTCGEAYCTNTVGSYQCSCQGYGQTYNLSTRRCEGGSGVTTSHPGKRVDPTDPIGPGSCRDQDCMFPCERFGTSFYCGCPLGYQLVDKGHCIATISPPDEDYFKGRLPLPHVPSGQGNRLPLGEGCWLCGVSQVEKAGLVSRVANALKSPNSRKRRDITSPLTDEELQAMLATPIRIVVNTSMTKVKDNNNILTMLPKSDGKETYQLFGDGKLKFRLDYHPGNGVSLKFRHKVTKQRRYKLILLVSEEPDDLLLLPIEVTVVTLHTSQE